MPETASERALSSAMPDIEDFDLVPPNSVRDQVIPVDHEFANIGPFTRTTDVGKARQAVDLAKELMSKTYGALRIVLRNVVADAIQCPERARRPFNAHSPTSS